MAESLRSKFEEHLSCALCLEQLEDPKVLPCLHSYCQKCISKLDMSGNILTCPECRATLKVPNPPDVSFLPSNFFAKNLLATLLLTAEPNSGSIVCENCESGESPETRCQQCTRFLCKFCTEVHTRFRDTKTHTLRTLDELRESNTPVIAEIVRCTKHEGEVIKLYCKTCKETICRDCAIVDHRPHDFVFVRDVFQEKKDELLHLLGDVKLRRGEMSESLAYLKKMEEYVNESSKSAVQKINRYFGNLGSTIESKKTELLEEAMAAQIAKLKQLHLQQEELELNLGSCDSSIDFTEQAFKNGSDVQILNLSKYMAQSLESIKNKETEADSIIGGDQQAELTEHVNLCDRMKQFGLVEDNKNSNEYSATFSSASKFLTVGEKSEIIIKRKFSSSAESNPGRIIPISPCFEGVGVKNIAVVSNEDGSRSVHFSPIHAGELTFVAYMNGSPVPSCVATKKVKKNNEMLEDFPIGVRVFECGSHRWNIDIDHSDCGSEKEVDFNVGVFDHADKSTVTFYGYVKPGVSERVNLKLNMEENELTVTSSWTWRYYTFDKEFKRVSPYFSSNCNTCKLTVSDGEWCFVNANTDF